MSIESFDYPALLLSQGHQAPPLVLFSASAVEISDWVGIPQKTRLLEGETLGFQRDDDPVRINQISKFYQDPRNVIHNPLLCAIRNDLGQEITFTPTSHSDAVPSLLDHAIPGTLTIKTKIRSNQPLRELFKDARIALELRVPSLKDKTDPEVLIAKLREQIDTPAEHLEHDELLRELSEVDNTDGFNESSIATEEALFEESHVEEFWAELRAREILLEQLRDQFSGEEFLGFTREAVEAYLRPVVLVDGQHRLLGAMQAARLSIDGDPDTVEQATRLLSEGLTANEVERKILGQKARQLSISMLLDAKPEEHVFQFVVVNQKATPVRPALLATIISTSLSEDELEPISDRLENAGIPLKTSRAISFFAKNASSPFSGLVSRGFEGEGNDLLPWTVLGQLVTMFRDLKGAKFFHDGKLDYADAWKRRYLEGSKVSQSQSADTTTYDHWRHPDGPWKEVFIAFWSSVRDQLGSTENPDAGNFWGRPRNSNLFNKPSLLTLATDFFAFLTETRTVIESVEQISALVSDWLVDVDKNYFARDWKLSGVKKDAPGTRKQWSKIWYNYRRDPRQLPKITDFAVIYKEGR